MVVVDVFRYARSRLLYSGTIVVIVIIATYYVVIIESSGEDTAAGGWEREGSHLLQTGNACGQMRDQPLFDAGVDTLHLADVAAYLTGALVEARLELL